ncbi:MAG: hypothetical protein DMF45_07015 [Verrucomicrobia bacterium]|nr:MAG: hypothetical protein DMF45_07015 [Verrucomicrobiota bacterium]
MLVCFLLLSGQHLSHFLLIMVTSLKQRGCVVAVALLGVLSLSQGQTNPAPAGPAQPPDPIKPVDHPQMLLAQALVQAASPAAASTTKSTTTSSTVATPVLTEADATVESGGVGVREFQGDDVGQVLRLLARQAKVNMVVSDAVTGTVTMRLEDVTALQAISIIVKAKGLFMDKIDTVYYIKTATERTAEPTESDSYQFSYARAKDISPLLASQLASKDPPQIDERTNTIFFRETRSNIDNIRKMLVQIDKPTKQVMIEARLVEVSADPVQAYGINWAGTVGSATAPKTVAYGNPIASGSPVPGANPPTSGFSLGNPNAQAVFGGFQDKTFGNTLIVRPSINKDNFITLSVKPEISNKVNDFHFVFNGADVTSPIIDKRSLDSNVLIKSGDTLALGGLISDQVSKSRTKVPLLGDIPVIGYAFQSHDNERHKRNLLIFVTPTIIDQRYGTGLEDQVSGVHHVGEEYADPNGWRNNAKGAVRLVPTSHRQLAADYAKPGEPPPPEEAARVQFKGSAKDRDE